VGQTREFALHYWTVGDDPIEVWHAASELSKTDSPVRGGFGNNSLLFPAFCAWTPECNKIGSPGFPDDFVTSSFGPRGGSFHNGADYGVLGPLVAPFNGVVVDAGYNDTDGNFVVLQTHQGARPLTRISLVHLGYRFDEINGREAHAFEKRVGWDGTTMWTYHTDMDHIAEGKLPKHARVMSIARDNGTTVAIPLDSQAATDAVAGWDVILAASALAGRTVSAATSLLYPSELGDGTNYPLRAYKSGIRIGQSLKQGDLIGYVGNTGSVSSSQTGPLAGTHLHLVVRQHTDTADRWYYVDPQQLTWRQMT
jgi:hypothetical protein